MIKKIFHSIRKSIKSLVQTGFSEIFVSSVINNILSFIGGTILVRVVDKGDYGIYSYANNIYSSIILLSGVGLVQGVFQLCCEKQQNKIEQQSIYDYGCGIGVIVNTLLGFLLLGISFLTDLPIVGANLMLKMMAFLPVGLIIYDFIGIYFRFTFENRKYAYFNVCYAVVYFLTSVIGAIYNGAEGLIIASYLTYGLCIFIGIYLLKARFKIYKIKKVIDEKFLLYKISLISLANNSLSKMMYMVDVFALGLVLKDESVIASYKIATTIPTALLFIPLTICVYVYPFFAAHKDDYDWNKRNFKKLITSVTLFNTILTSVIFICANRIIKIVFGTQYLDSVIPFKILVVNYFFNASFRIVVGNLLVAIRKLKFNFFEALLSGIVNIVGDVLLIPWLGSIGAALSTLIVTIFSSSLCFGYYIRCIKKLKVKRICEE